MEREGAETAVKRSKPAYVRYFLSDGVGFILSLPPDIRRFVTSDRYWTHFDCLMVTMAHFDWEPNKTSLEKLMKVQEQSAYDGSYAQFRHFCQYVPREYWNRVQLSNQVAMGGDVEKMALLHRLNMIEESRNYQLENTAAFFGRPEMLRYLDSLQPLTPSRRYISETLQAAAIGGHMNTFKECLSNLEEMNRHGAWIIYRSLIKHGRLHIIEWLETSGQLEVPKGGHSWRIEWNWRFFNEEFQGMYRAENTAIKDGQIHILEWIHKKGWILRPSSDLLEIAIHIPPIEIATFKSIDWILDNFSIESINQVDHLICEAVMENYFDVSRHMFKRGVVLNTDRLSMLTLPDQGGFRDIAKMVKELLQPVENAENEPDKYIVQAVDGHRCVRLRHPSSEHYQRT